MRKKINKIYESTNPNTSEKFLSASLSFPSGNFYSGSDETRSVYIWQAGMMNPIITLSDHSSAVHSMLLNSDDAELFAGMKGGRIAQWDIYKRKIKNDLIGHSTQITCMAFYRVKNEVCALASASAEGKIKIWDLKIKPEPRNFKGHFTEVDCLDFSPDFTYLVSGSQDGVVKIWDIRNLQKSLNEICNKDKKGINCIKFNPWKTHFAFGSKNKTVEYWDLKNFELIGKTNTDRLPIEKIEFDNQGNNLFYATNEALKYWEIGNKGLSLITMHETGWNRLQDFKYIDSKEICACSIKANKLSYYSIKYKDFFGKIANVSIMSNIEEESPSNFLDDSEIHINFNGTNKSIGRKIPSAKNKNHKKFEEYENTNIVLDNLKANEPLGLSKFIDTSMTDATVNSSKIEFESVFAKNALNMINPPEKKNQSKKNNNNVNLSSNGDMSIGNFISPNLVNATTNSIELSKLDNQSEFEVNLDGNEKLDYSIIKKIDEDSFLDEPIFSSIKKEKENTNKQNNNIKNDNLNLENKNNNKENTNNNINDNTKMNKTNSSFKSFKTNETMGLDFEKLLQKDGDMTMHMISQSEDPQIMQELNQQHDAICKLITKRYNSMKNIEKSWSDSDISTTIEFIQIIKDVGIIHDFFNYAIVEKDNINIIPFTLDHFIKLIPFIMKLMTLKYEPYCLTAIKSALIFIKTLQEKIKDTYKNKENNNNGYDPKLDDRIQKCDEIIKYFKQIYQMKELEKLRNKKSKLNTNELANQLYNEIGNFLNSLS